MGGSFSHQEPAFMKAGGLEISRKGYDLIIKHEVGGGVTYYNRYLKALTYPGGNSGITGGIGYDFGWQSRAQIARDWGGIVSPSILRRLQACSGKKRGAAKAHVKYVRSIKITWDMAIAVYHKKTIPRFGALTLKAYPGIDAANPDIQGVYLSWTFNRGSGISSTSSRDKEKRELRTYARTQEWWKIPDAIRRSIRLWVGKGLDGLIRRRRDEANLAESSL